MIIVAVLIGIPVAVGLALALAPAAMGAINWWEQHKETKLW